MKSVSFSFRTHVVLAVVEICNHL